MAVSIRDDAKTVFLRSLPDLDSDRVINSTAEVMWAQCVKDIYVLSELTAQFSMNDAVEMDDTYQNLKLATPLRSLPAHLPPPLGDRDQVSFAPRLRTVTPLVPCRLNQAKVKLHHLPLSTIRNLKARSQLLENRHRVNERQRHLELNQLDSESAANENSLSQLWGGLQG